MDSNKLDENFISQMMLETYQEQEKLQRDANSQGNLNDYFENKITSKNYEVFKGDYLEDLEAHRFHWGEKVCDFPKDWGIFQKLHSIEEVNNFCFYIQYHSSFDPDGLFELFHHATSGKFQSLIICIKNANIVSLGLYEESPQNLLEIVGMDSVDLRLENESLNDLAAS